jgi:hypothetical protein
MGVIWLNNFFFTLASQGIKGLQEYAIISEASSQQSELCKSLNFTPKSVSRFLEQGRRIKKLDNFHERTN